MTIRGHVRHGQVVLDHPAALPDGAEVQVSSVPCNARTTAYGSLTSADGEASDGVRRRFHQLAGEWKQATLLTSSGTEMLLHPAYQQIIGMGPEAVPLLVAELRRDPDHWFWALKAITGEDPVAEGDRGNLARMTDAWLKWAEQRGY
ncbi:MAG TPA: hypothetical protein VFI31_10695 [Pirellulales bacterium]|nr:hypothetical protein [Pirellulales bacterium]